MLKILIISNKNQTYPSIRYRLIYPLDIMKEELGIQYDLVSFFSQQTSRILNSNKQFLKLIYSLIDSMKFCVKFFRAVFQYDVVIVKNYLIPIGGGGIEKVFYWLLRKKLIIYDIDDGIYLNQTRYQNKMFSYLRNADKKVEFWAKKVDNIFVSNMLIMQDMIERYNIDKDNFIQFLSCPYKKQYFSRSDDIYDEKASREQIRIIWLGSPHTQDELKIFEQYIALLPSYLPNAKIILMGASEEFVLFRHLRHVEFIEWSQENEYKEMRKAHFGLNPLNDSDFQRRKSAFKVIQYYRAGIIPIVSNVGINKALIEKYGGFCCDKDDNYMEINDFMIHMNELGIEENVKLYKKTMHLSVEDNRKIIQQTIFKKNNL